MKYKLAIIFILSFFVEILTIGILQWANGDVIFAIVCVGGLLINRLDEYHYGEHEEEDEERTSGKID